MEGKMETQEEHRIDGIIDCAKIIVFWAYAIKTRGKKDEDTREQMTSWLDTLCVIMGHWGRKEMDAASELYNRMRKEVDDAVEKEEQTCDRRADQ